MAMRERQELAGRVHVVLRDPAGHVVERRQVNNLITTAGRRLLADALTGTVQIDSQSLRIVVGSSGATPTAADTALGAQVDGAPAQILPPKETSDSGSVRVVATISATLPATGAAAPQQLQEAGIVIALPDRPPVLYNHVTFPVITRSRQPGNDLELGGDVLMGDPYVKANPGDIIRAQDWNDLQSQARDEIHGHLHTGGDQGKLLTGASIDPATTLKVAELEVTGDLLAKTRRLLDEIDKIMARLTTLEARTASTGPLTVDGDLNLGNSAVFFLKTDHPWRDPSLANVATIQNASNPNYNALMIVGRQTGSRRDVKLWDYLQVNGALDVTGIIQAGNLIAMSDHEIWLRGPTDGNHGLSYRTRDIDGPLLWGFSSGGGTANGKVAMNWRSDGTVTI